jgi:hypothetical protein
VTKTTQLALFVFFVALSVLGSLWIWDSRSRRVLWCALAHRSTKVTHVKTTKGTEYLLGKCARCGATTWERI